MLIHLQFSYKCLCHSRDKNVGQNEIICAPTMFKKWVERTVPPFPFCENVDLRLVVVWLVRGGIFCDKFWEQRKKEAQEIGLFGAEKVKSVTKQLKGKLRFKRKG